MNEPTMSLRIVAVAVALAVSSLSALGVASGQSLVLDGEGRLVQFERDIAPILVSKCLECHGPKEAKNDFRVDEADSLMSYVEPEDVAASSLFTDYLVSEDDDMRMPPAAHNQPLTAGELALIRTWIAEGAIWPEGFVLVEKDAAATESQIIDVLKPSDGLVARLWAFQGYLHPATVHFPIALLMLGSFFVVLGWKWPAVGTQVPLACLWLGAPAAIAATLMGWSFATERGYAGWDRIDMDSEVFWHRWSAVIITLIAIVSAVIAIVAVKRQSRSLAMAWKGGLLLAGMLVGLVGHQGGELTYGKTFYQKAFDRLWPPSEITLPEVSAATPSGDSVSAAQSPDSDVRSIASGKVDKSIR